MIEPPTKRRKTSEAAPIATEGVAGTSSAAGAGTNNAATAKAEEKMKNAHLKKIFDR